MQLILETGSRRKYDTGSGHFGSSLSHGECRHGAVEIADVGCKHRRIPLSWLMLLEKNYKQNDESISSWTPSMMSREPRISTWGRPHYWSYVRNLSWPYSTRKCRRDKAKNKNKNNKNKKHTYSLWGKGGLWEGSGRLVIPELFWPCISSTLDLAYSIWQAS